MVDSASLGFMNPMTVGSKKPFFHQINQFVILSKWVILVGDWIAILYLDLDHEGVRKIVNIPFNVKRKCFCEFITRLNLVNKKQV